MSSSQNEHTLGGEGGDMLGNEQGRTRGEWGVKTRESWANIPFECPPMSGDKNKWESNIYYNIATLSYFISLETASTSTQKSEVFLLRISLGNVNVSVVTCLYAQIYNFSFRKKILESL